MTIHLIMPDRVRHPIIISAPHVGVAFPPEVRHGFLDDVLAFPQDADWLVHELYRELAEELGLIMLWPEYSRYVVDLNRDPDGRSLYADGRRETSVVPRVSFAGTALYRSGHEPDQTEVDRRVTLYHAPYYQKIAGLIEGLKKVHPHVLFYDAHSIKRSVPSIRPEPFPDMILGTNRGQSAAEELAQAALRSLQRGQYDVRRDEIFFGGYLTRFFGQPKQGIHALQLERCWDIYLKDDPRTLDKDKATRLKGVLRQMMMDLARQLSKLGSPEATSL